MWGKNRIKDQLHWAEKQLAKVGIHDGRLIARVLMEYVLTAPGDVPKPYTLRYREDEKITRENQTKFRDYVFRRMRGEATSRITGYREFWSLPFKLNSATLDPRSDTETLVETALKQLSARDADYKKRAWKMLDLGTGTGCIIISLLHELPAAQGFAGDASMQALEAAMENGHLNNVADRLHLFASDWASAISTVDEAQKFDLIACNPPYVPEYYRTLLSNEVLHFDPPLALWGGPTGLDGYAKVMPQIKDMLKKDGLGFLEIGADQADAVAQIVVDHGFTVIEVVRDLSGHARCIVLRHSARSN